MRKRTIILGILLSAVTMLFYQSCEKDKAELNSNSKDNNSTHEVQVSSDLFVHKIDPSNAEGLLQKTTDGNQVIELYGDYTSDGFPNEIHGMRISQKNNDTSFIYHFNYDGSIKYFYRAYKNMKESYIVYIHYTKSDTIYTSLIEYDWISDKGVFVADIKVPLSLQKSSTMSKSMYGGSNSIDGCLENFKQDYIGTINNESNKIWEKVSDLSYSAFSAGVGTYVATALVTTTAPVSLTVAGTVTLVAGGIYAVSKAIPALKDVGLFDDYFKSSTGGLQNYSCNIDDYTDHNEIDSGKCGVIMSCGETEETDNSVQSIAFESEGASIEKPISLNNEYVYPESYINENNDSLYQHITDTAKAREIYEKHKQSNSWVMEYDGIYLYSIYDSTNFTPYSVYFSFYSREIEYWTCVDPIYEPDGHYYCGEPDYINVYEIAPN